MKKLFRQVFCSVLLLAVASLSYANCTDLFIENNSGWALTIRSTVSNNAQETPMRQGETFKKVGCLEEISALDFYRRGQLWGNMAPATSLNNIVRLFKAKAAMYAKHDAVIVINGTTLGWDVRGQWRKQGGGVIPISDEELSGVTLQNVRDGELGQEFAKKVNDIISADYSVAEKKGFVNLAARLEKEFSEVRFQTQPRETPRAVGGNVVTTYREQVYVPSSLTKNDAKDTINRIYKSYGNYKTKGYIN